MAFVGGLDVKVMVWGGATGPEPDVGSSAMTPTAVVVFDGQSDQNDLDTAPGEVAFLVARLICEFVEFNVESTEVPLGGLVRNGRPPVPSVKRRRSLVWVVVTAGVLTPATADATSTGWLVLTPLNAWVSIATCDAGLSVAWATGGALPTTPVQAAN
jgi:hypothetical protein